MDQRAGFLSKPEREQRGEALNGNGKMIEGGPCNRYRGCDRLPKALRGDLVAALKINHLHTNVVMNDEDLLRNKRDVCMYL